MILINHDSIDKNLTTTNNHTRNIRNNMLIPGQPKQGMLS